MPARDGQLVGQKAQQGIGQTQIAFAIFKINWIDLVRHGRGTGLAGHHSLLKIAQRHIAPGIASKIDQHRVHAGQCVKIFSHPVMGFDLGGVGIPLQIQRLHKSLAKRLPVDIWIGHHMRVEIAHGAVDFAQHYHRCKAIMLPLQAVGDVGDFLAQSGGRGGLTVSSGHHRYAGLRVRKVCQSINQPG